MDKQTDFLGGEKRTYKRREFAGPRELPRQDEGPFPLQAEANDSGQKKIKGASK